MELNAEKAILVGLCTGENTEELCNISMDELERLLETAGGACYGRVVQKADKPNPRTLIGSGKVAELRAICNLAEIRLVVFDEELSPSQIRCLEDDLGGEINVLDRTMLILDIFALHAESKEGKLQVELAQLKYTAPRLYGKGAELSRLGGGIGTRGPGESKLETDKRHIQRRITALEAELNEMEKNRRTMRAARDRSGIMKVAVVGYTNAGKSTLLNRLTDAGILAEDKLFATLDPTTRKFILPDGETILLTDTVGFIRKLPHHLIHAFKSTLEEAVCADALLIVLDISDPEYRSQLAVTEELLEELGAGGKPTVYVLNKCDKGAADAFPSIGTAPIRPDTVSVSAVTGQGIDLLTEKIENLLHGGRKTVVFHIPNSDGNALNYLYQNAKVEDVEYGSEMLVTATVDAKTHGMMRKYDPEWVDREEE